MPEIRSITYFTNITEYDLPAPLIPAGKFLQDARAMLQAAGITVQTVRVGTQPFPHGFKQRVLKDIQNISHASLDNGIDYIAMGSVSASDETRYMDALPDIIATTPNVFVTVNIGDYENGIDLAHLRRTAAAIEAISRISEDGMGNLFLAAIANCPPFSPFFPVAYHDGGEPAFAFAVQAADLANLAFENAHTPEEASRNLTDAINAYAAQVVPLAKAIAAKYGITFKGLDFSLAPYPINEKSLGGALEALGTPFGGQGLVAAASLIMNAVEAAEFPSVGFSGLMLPVLEDSVLGLRAAEGRLRVNDLLLLSAICGTGLDCIPLAGDVGVENMYAILLDIASLALRLNKPLTARLLPFPNKKAGDPLTFDFEYFANSAVMPSPQFSIQKDRALGAEDGKLSVLPRHRNKA